RAALGAIKSEPTTKVENYVLRLENVGSPEDLARALATVRGKSVSITVRVRSDQQEDRRQLNLFKEPSGSHIQVAEGATWLKKALTIDEQRVLVNGCRAIMDGPAGGYVPSVRGG